MTVQLFIQLLAMFSVLTGLMVEAEKIILDERNIAYSANLMALITALIIGMFGTAIYYIMCYVPFTLQNCLCMFLMGIASGLSAMVGYDKLKQLVGQLQ